MVLFLIVPLVIFLVIWFSIYSVLWIRSTVPARLFCVFFFCQDLSKFCFFFPFYLLSFTVNQINFGKEPFLNVTWPDKLQFVPDAHFALKVCAQFQPFSKPIWQHGSCIHLPMASKHRQYYLTLYTQTMPSMNAIQSSDYIYFSTLSSHLSASCVT